MTSTTRHINQGSPEHDETTGLLRKSVFQRDLDQFAETAVREKSPLAMIMIDLDRFKAINDNHGHPIGDEVLHAVSGIIRDVANNRGRVYRYGGEEICVLLPNHTAIEAMCLAERLRRAISKEPLSSKKLTVTASLGVSELDNSVGSSAALLEQADKAMYDAKKLGRDLVRIFGEPPPSKELPGESLPPRKQPLDQGPFDKAAKESIRQNFFQSGVARCPFDSASLNVHPYYIDERRTADLDVSCPMCGVSDFIQGPE